MERASKQSHPKNLDKLLNTIPIFKNLSGESISKITSLLEPLSYYRDSMIIKEGSKGDAMFIIDEGTVKISCAQEDGEDVFIGFLYAGSYFGEFSLFDNLPRSANITAVENTEVYKLTKNDFDTLLSTDLSLGNKIYQNCLKETFLRFRNTVSDFTFSQHNLRDRSAKLEEINRDLSLAKKLQSYFIDTEYLQNQTISRIGVKHSYIYHPCIDVGGDFINIVELKDDRVGVIIADVEGHGIHAALATGVLKSAISIMADTLGDRPEAFMDFLNKHFIEVISQLFATCYYALIDMREKTITMCKAGHHHPLFWKKQLNGFVDISCIGTGLGVMEESKYEQETFDIEDGDKILFFTDGIIEQFNKSEEMYSGPRLTSQFEALIKNNDSHIVNQLFKDVKSFSGGREYQDDITLLLFEF